MSFHIGDKVRVALNPHSQIPKNPIAKYNGQEFIVQRVKLSYIAQSPRRQFLLYGCESDKGVPYWFLDEDLKESRK